MAYTAAVNLAAVLRLQDELTKPLDSAIRGAKEQFDSLSVTAQRAGKIRAFDALTAEVDALSAALAEAKRKRDFFVQSAETGGADGVRMFGQDIRNAKQEVLDLERALNQKSATLRDVGRDLRDTGVDITNLGGSLAKLDAELAKEKNAKEFQARIDAIGNKAVAAGQKMESIGLRLGGVGIAGQAALGQVGLDMRSLVGGAMDVEKSLYGIASTAGLTGDQARQAINAWSGQINQIARDTNQQQSSVVAALNTLVAKGLPTETALAMLAPIGQAATAAQGDILSMATATEASFSKLGLTVAEAGKGLDIMAQAGKSGAFELRDMAGYFEMLTSKAEVLGIKGTSGLAQLASAAQISRRASGDASSAANNLGNWLNKLNAASTAKTFETMGADLEAVKQRARESGDFIGGMADEIKRMTGGDTAKIAKLFPDAEAGQFVQRLILDLEDYRKIGAESFAAVGVAAKDFDTQMQSSAAQMDKFRIGATASVNDGGAMREILDTLNGITTWANANPELAKWLIFGTAGLAMGGAAIAGIGAIVTSIGTMIPAMAAVGTFLAANPVTAAILGFGAGYVVGGYISDWLDSQIAALTGEKGATLGGKLYDLIEGPGGIVPTIKSSWETLKQAGANLMQGLRDGITAGLKGELGIGKKLAEAVGWLKTQAGEWVAIGGHIVDGIIRGIQAKAQAMWDEVKALGRGALKSIKETLDIRSPSREFEQVGLYMAEGMSLGINKGTLGVQRSLDDMAATALSTGYDLQGFGDPFAAAAEDLEAIAKGATAAEKALAKLGGKTATPQTFRDSSGRFLPADEAKRAAAEWDRASNDIERSLTDALMRGFEGGKDWAENFRDTLKNLFNTLVLRPIIQPIAQYGAQALMGMVGMGGAGAASANPLSLLSTASSLSGTAGVLSNTASGLMSGATSIGSILGASGTNIAAAASYGTAIGSAQTAALVAQEAGMAASAGASGAISGALSAIPVWGWAAMAGMALFGDKIFGGKTTQTDAGVNLSVVGGQAINGYSYADYERDGGWFGSDSNWRTATGMDTSTLTAGLSQVASLLGQIGGPDAVARLRTYTASYEGAQEGTQAWIATVLDGMATLTLGNYWARFAREGEAATESLQRLITTLGTVSALRASLSDTVAVVSGQITEAEAAARAAGREMQGLYALLGQTQDVQTRIELEGQLQSAATTRYQAELQYLNTLRDTITQLSASIASTRAAVSSSLQEISPIAVPTAAQLREAIAGVSGPSLPSLSGVMAASDRAAWAQQAATLGETITAASARMTAAQAAIAPLSAQYAAALAPYGATGYINERGSGYTAGAGNTLPTGFSPAWYDLWYNHANPLTAAAEPYQQEWSAARQALAPAQAAMTAGNAIYGQSLSIADAQAALAAAQAAYSTALTGYAGDAQDAISALESLRGETMRYYQAQAALADLMSDSATRLRDAASAARLTLGGNASAAASLARQYDQAYTLALSTGGETLAGYADTLTTLLPDLLTTLADESSSRIEYQRRAALAISQSEAIAARLDSQAPQGYESESLSLLGAIDTGLLALSEGLESIDQQILAAIQGSRDATVDVLTQIRDLLGYELPGHADGLARVPYDDYAARLHAGEAVIDAGTMTGLRRYGIPVHSAAPAGGSVDSTALIAEVRALRADNADLRAEVRAVVTHTARTARLLDRVMPDGDALAVRVEVAA
jgi:hypothetical protein